MEKPIYLDHHSTTPLDPKVFDSMKPYFVEHFGNSSSRHEYGWTTAKAVEDARTEVAQLIGCLPKEIFFTSGATESNNIALQGVMAALPPSKRKIISSKIEHKSVLEVLEQLSKFGVKVVLLEVDSTGQVPLNSLAEALDEETGLVSLMWANNEIGTIQRMNQIGELTRARGIYFHSDATQAIGRTHVNVKEAHVDLLSLSAHKFHGPKGVGTLFVRSQNPRVKILSPIVGGGQERGIRAGTLNVPGIVGLGTASRVMRENFSEENARIRMLRDLLQKEILEKLPQARVNGHPSDRLPHNLSVTVPGAPSERVLPHLHRDIALSTGSACSSAMAGSSHVLKAIGVSEDDARCTYRFSLGRFTTETEIREAAQKFVAAVQRTSVEVLN